MQQIFEPHAPLGFIWGEGVEGGRHLWIKKVLGDAFPSEASGGFYNEVSGNLLKPLGNGELTFRSKFFRDRG